MAERTRYQEKVIKNYYQNIDAISLSRLSDLVGELYLAAGKNAKRPGNGSRRRWKN